MLGSKSQSLYLHQENVIKDNTVVGSAIHKLALSDTP